MFAPIFCIFEEQIAIFAFTQEILENFGKISRMFLSSNMSYFKIIKQGVNISIALIILL